MPDQLCIESARAFAGDQPTLMPMPEALKPTRRTPPCGMSVAFPPPLPLELGSMSIAASSVSDAIHGVSHTSLFPRALCDLICKRFRRRGHRHSQHHTARYMFAQQIRCKEILPRSTHHKC